MKRVLQLSLIAAAFTLLVLGSGKSSAFQEEVTFNNQVVRIFQAKCQVCHHPGDIAPFSLMTYAEARPWARAIQEKVVLREMPPWKPVDGCGEFDGDRRLTDDEIATISRWADSSAREGDPALLPEPRTFPDVWPLGPPDVVLQPEGDYVVKPGADIYRCFSIPTALRGDRYISAVEIKPGNRNVVHHVIIYLDRTGASKQLDDADPEPGYTSFGGPGFDAAGTLGGWSPGARGRFEPEGNAWLLTEGVRAVIQVHYHPRGNTTETDRTQVGLYYARQPVRKDIQAVPIVNDSFRIPAGDPHYRVTASQTVPPGLALHLIGVYPHMHLLGREMSVEAQSPDGSSRCLINIDKWSFQWQGMYFFKEQIPLPAGTTVRVTSYYDNSAGNPLNPNNPPKPVAWGEQTTDEMCVLFLEVSLDAQNRTPSSPTIKSVSIDSNTLVVQGQRFLPGSDIEIDGTRLSDTINHKKKKKATKQLMSGGDWKSLLVPGRASSITVLNTDGARSDAVAFTR
jgi:hypothetical protein